MKNYTLFVIIFFLICLLAPENLMSQDLDSGQQITSMVIEAGGTGIYKAIALGDEKLPTFTIYRPQNLDMFGDDQKLPIVLWGNGGCMDTSAGAMNFLNEIASHGFIVFAIGPFSSLKDAPKLAAMMEAMRRNPPSTSTPLNERRPLPRPPSSSTRLIEALDWAISENSRESGMYFGKLDISKVVPMGTSCGGLQTMEISPDPRITTSILFNSGILNEAPPPGISVPVVKKDTLKQLHAPILYIIGGPEDIAYPNAVDDFSRIDKVPVVMLNQDVGHGGTFREPHGGSFAVVALAWLKWQLKGDAEAALMFRGKDCGLCNDPQWTIETKNFDMGVQAVQGHTIERPMSGYITIPAPDVKEVKQSLIEGETNVWYEYIPTFYTGDKAVPLVIALHGGGGTGKGQASHSSWSKVADRENIIIVYPNYAGKDPEFLKKLIDVISGKYNIDKTRIYMDGFSMGDIMTFAFARKYGDVLAAAACFGGPTAPESIKEATPVASLPIFQIRGEEDTLTGGGGKPDPNDRYAVRAKLNDYNREYWLKANKTNTIPEISVQGYESHAIYRSDAGDVIYTEIKGMSHQELIYAADLVWNHFFSGYSRVNGKIVESAPLQKLEGDKNALAIVVGSTRALINNKVVKIDDLNPHASPVMVTNTLPPWASRIPKAEAEAIDFSTMFGDIGKPTMYFPVKFLEKAFGATVDVLNEGKTARITTADQKTYELYDKSQAVFSDGKVTGIHMPAFTHNGTLLVPARAVSEILFNKNVSECNEVIYISDDHGDKLSRGIARIIKKHLGS